MGSFTTAMGDRRPRLLVKERDGHLEHADPDVVLQLAAELETQAEEEHHALLELMSKKLSSIGPKEAPIIEGTTEPTAEASPTVASHGEQQPT